MNTRTHLKGDLHEGDQLSATFIKERVLVDGRLLLLNAALAVF